MRFVLVTEIDAPREAVWAQLSDLRSYLEFVEGLTGWKYVGGPPFGLGARFRVFLCIGPVELGELIEIVELNAPAELAWVGVTGVDHRGRWRLRESSPGRTRVELRVSYHAPGGVGSRVADLVAAPIVKRHFRRSMRNLKERLETT